MKHIFLAAWLLFGVFGNILNAQTNITKTSVFAPNNIQVNTYTGALFHERQDLLIPGRGLSIDVTFSYNSNARDRDWGYGRGWTHNYNMLYYTDSTNAVIIQQMDGRKNRYPVNGGGGYLRPAGVFDSLEQYQAGKLRLRSTDGTLYFFDNGTHRRITKIEDRNGNTLTFGYTDSLLTTITDPSGRFVQFTWTDGRLTKLTDPNLSPAREIVYEYDNLGEPRYVTDPLGNFIEYRYDDEYKMTAVINENGVPVNIEYNSLTAARRIVSCVSTMTISYNYELRRTYLVETVGGQDQITTYEYDDQGRLARQFGNCCGYDVRYEYDANNNISKRTDANGNATTYAYDANGNVIRETDPLGNAETYTYEPVFNQLQSVTDRNGNTTAHVFDAKGNLLSRARPLGITESFTYDAFGNPTSFTDGRGNTTTYAYNANGYLTGITDPEGGTTSLTYDGVGNNVSFTDPNNHTTTIEYDRKNREKKITDALGNFIEYTYDPVGNQTSFKDQNGHITTYNYDGVNRLLATVNPLGHTTSFTYDERGNTIAVKNGNGNTTHFEYNTLNRLVKKTSPVGDVTLYDYDGVGNLTTAALPGGNVVQVAYDKLNRIAQISDALGLVAKYTYDKNSNRLSVADGNDNTAQYTYDAIDRVLTSRDPSGKLAQYDYDKNDNLTQIADRRGNVTVLTFDKLNRRTTSKDPLNNLTTFTYDPAGNLLTLKDAKNNTTTYAYDAIDRRITETYPNGDQRALAYDPAGNLTARTEPNGYTISFTYDDANRLLTRNYPNSVTETFTYDNVGQILSAANPHSTVTMAYDAADRMVSETLNGRTTAYTYNTNARTRRITYPGGKQVLEQYDPRGRLQQVQDNTVSATDPLAAFEYDPGNRLLRKVFNNTAVSEYAYDLNSNLVQINHLLNSMVRYEYAYDNNDNKLYERNNAQPTKSNQFLYDVYNRLTRFKKGTLAGANIPTPADDILYNYDGVHNRQTVQANGTTTTYTANNLNQYTMLAGGVTATLTYDANGNLLSDGTNTYAYDFENRLVTVNGGATAKYFYDALGRRILKVAGADSTFYNYSQLRVIEERGASGGPVTASYVYGADLDEVLSMQRGGQTYYYHHNALGSVTHVTNTAGAIVEQYEYDAYGQVSFFTGAYAPLTASAIGNPVLFTGQRYDAESGLYFYKARYYSPVLGRFLQRDPLGFVDGNNLYAYVMNNPAKYIDEFGLCTTPPWSSLDNFHWYGNWGGPGWASGGWNSESNVNMPRNPSNPNYKEPINKRDRCYYGHDTCLNDCTYICNPDARKNCRVECDKKLSNCLQNLPKSYTKTWGGSVCRWIEESLFGSGWVNNNPGTYNNRR
jgi:RHS repeat-associated protein